MTVNRADDERASAAGATAVAVIEIAAPSSTAGVPAAPSSADEAGPGTATETARVRTESRLSPGEAARPVAALTPALNKKIPGRPILPITKKTGATTTTIDSSS